MKNITLLTDSYKIGHYPMYPKGTQIVHSYFESRKGATFNNTVFFGLQALLAKYLEGYVVTKEKIDEGQAIIDAHLGPGVFNREGWEYILNNYGGRLPLEIKAIPEGTPVPTNNVLMTIENTDTNCWWLTNFVETILTHVWYSSTVASLSREVKLMINHYLEETTNNMAGLPFMLHDFGYRGVSSVESAEAGGAGHLVNFMGTDTIAAIEYAMEYYDSDVCAFSVNATEHSIMTARGPIGEAVVFDNLLRQYRAGILSVVIDSYDYRRFILEYARKMRDLILTRGANANGIPGKVVFRPDSGDPVAVTLEVLGMLGEVFGAEENNKGYKVLNPQVGMLWGDGIDYHGIRNILHAMKASGWSAENIVFGMGGGLLQKVNRDTQRFAFKCSAQYYDGKWFDVFKSPVDSTKESKKGRQHLYRRNGRYITTNIETADEKDLLETVFLNGEIVKEYNFEEVRRNAQI